ncbi:MAG: ADP-ribosylglycohydrolase family protein [Micrococcales bacterium]|nr:ADP-ribosylglycohydrolase family protein [Micrococcales bacterium]
MHLEISADERVRLCGDSLAGLSVGDALGAQFFVPGNDPASLADGTVPDGVWPWTDDTDMACTVVAELVTHQRIDQDRLATAFAQRCDPYRGYGAGAVVVLHQIRDGVPWAQATRSAFAGGSFGNGAAMRVAPLGAFFAGDLDQAATQAIASAEVTHAHPEGIVGAVVVAVATAFVAQARNAGTCPTPEQVVASANPYLVPGALSRGVSTASAMLTASAEEAAWTLGNGAQVSAQDTVPFALWVAATHLSDYPAAITACVEAGGDVDTTAAITGGIVAAFTGIGDHDATVGVPPTWLTHREPLPDRPHPTR